MSVRRTRHEQPRSRLHLLDQVQEAWMSLRATPVRSVMMSLGVVLGVGTAIATTGIAQSTQANVEATFAALRPTKVDVLWSSDGSETGSDQTLFPPAGIARIRDLSGVRGVGEYTDQQTSTLTFSSSRHGLDELSLSPHLVGADARFLDAARARHTGAELTDWHMTDALPVALVGADLAEQLGIGPTESGRYVFVDGVALLAIGIVTDGGHLPMLTSSVILPASTQRALFPPAATQLLIDVERGAAPAVAAAAAYALDPARPDAFSIPDPADPRALKKAVEGDLSVLGTYLALVSTLVGMIGIGSSTFGTIYERLGEFGLRRALGARGGHLRRQVLTETLLAGLLAGVVGTVAGLAAVVVSAQAHGWVPVVEPRLVLAAPIIGLITGLGAGLPPAFKAGGIEPAEALRR